METYFTFPDGGLRYDCERCRQRCCRGKGIALSGAEIGPLLRRAPRLLPVLRLRPGGTYAAANLSDGCWFLQQDGLCQIEVAHGREIKPATCRLFPFNRVFRVEGVRVVDVNSVLCPVADAGGAGVRHAELIAEIEALSPSPLLDVPAPQPPELAPDWLAREVQVRDLAAAYKDDTSALLRATASDAEQAVADAAAWARLYDSDAQELAPWERAVAPQVALLLPSLRWNRLFHAQAAPYPRLFAGLPRRARALTLLGALAAQASGQAPSLRGLSELWQAQAGVLDVLERWREPARLAQPRFDADVPSSLHGALGRFLGGAFRGNQTLGELVQAAAAALPPGEGALAVALAASQLGSLLPA